MQLALILAGLALTCLGIFGWMWLCGGVRNPGWRSGAGAIALQLSGLCMIYGFVRGQPLNGVFLAAFPPFALTELVKASRFLPFLTDVAWRVVPYVAPVGALCLILRPLRCWAFGLTLATALIAAVFLGDTVSHLAMCKSAALRGFDSFERNSLAWSLANAPREWQPEIHARVALNGQTLGWSYGAQDWYVIPDGTLAEVTGPVVSCPTP